jgi:hypothetical protein
MYSGRVLYSFKAPFILLSQFQTLASICTLKITNNLQFFFDYVLLLLRVKDENNIWT